jgi:hypothetical protein
VSTNDAYVEPARDRPNLTVRGDVLVDRILLDGRRAVGVRTAAGEEIAARRSSSAPVPSTHRRSCCAPASGSTTDSRSGRISKNTLRRPDSKWR